jgi:hypothetical protein
MRAHGHTAPVRPPCSKTAEFHTCRYRTTRMQLADSACQSAATARRRRQHAARWCWRGNPAATTDTKLIALEGRARATACAAQATSSNSRCATAATRGGGRNDLLAGATEHSRSIAQLPTTCYAPVCCLLRAGRKNDWRPLPLPLAGYRALSTHSVPRHRPRTLVPSLGTTEQKHSHTSRL